MHYYASDILMDIPIPLLITWDSRIEPIDGGGTFGRRPSICGIPLSACSLHAELLPVDLVSNCSPSSPSKHILSIFQFFSETLNESCKAKYDIIMI